MLAYKHQAVDTSSNRKFRFRNGQEASRCNSKLYKHALDQSQQLNPIAVAIDRLKSDNVSLADAGHE